MYSKRTFFPIRNFDVDLRSRGQLHFTAECIVNQKKVETAIAGWYVESSFCFCKSSAEEPGIGSTVDVEATRVITENRKLKDLFWKTEDIEFVDTCPIGQLRRQDKKFGASDIFAYLDATSNENDGKY